MMLVKRGVLKYISVVLAICFFAMQPLAGFGGGSNAMAEVLPPHNLSLNKPTEASSVLGGNYMSGNAVDGVYHNGQFNAGVEFNLWTSQFSDSIGAWWLVDLQSESVLQDIQVQFRGLTGSYIGLSPEPIYFHIPKSITIQSSIDKVNWNTLVTSAKSTMENKSEYSPEFVTYELPENSIGRYVRLLFEEGAQDMTIDDGVISLSPWSRFKC